MLILARLTSRSSRSLAVMLDYAHSVNGRGRCQACFPGRVSRGNPLHRKLPASPPASSYPIPRSC